MKNLKRYGLLLFFAIASVMPMFARRDDIAFRDYEGPTLIHPFFTIVGMILATIVAFFIISVEHSQKENNGKNKGCGCFIWWLVWIGLGSLYVYLYYH